MSRRRLLLRQVVGGVAQSFVAAGAAASSATSSIAVPIPAGIAANDVLLVFLGLNEDVATFTDADSFGAQVAEIGQAAGTDNKGAIYVRVATGSEAATYTFTASVSTGMAGIMLAYRGFDTTTPTLNTSGNAVRPAFYDGAGAPNYQGTLPAMAADDWLVSFITSRDHGDLGAGNITVPTGHVLRYDDQPQANVSMTIADYEDANSPAASDWTTTGTTNTANRGCCLVAVLNVS